MRFRIRHDTLLSYPAPVKSVIMVLRLTPRSHEGQHIASWRIDLDVDCLLTASEDAFGNIVHTFNAEGPLQHVGVLVEGEVETFDAAGIVRGALERFPPQLYLRETPLTAADAQLRAFAAARRLGAGRSARRPAWIAERHSYDIGVRCEIRRHRDDGGPGSGARSAATRGTSPMCSSPAPGISIFRPATSAAFSWLPTAASNRKQIMPGPRLSCPTSAGSVLIRSTTSARRRPMSGSPAVSIISARRRCVPACAGGMSEAPTMMVRTGQKQGKRQSQSQKQS